MLSTSNIEKFTTSKNIELWLSKLIAFYLKLPYKELESDVPLSRYGMDSLTAVAIMTAISDETELLIADDLLFEYPTITSLTNYILTLTNNLQPAISEPCPGLLDQKTLMAQDKVLPGDIQLPLTELNANPKSILLTGVTGFLGIHLLDTLLINSDVDIICLIRATTTDKASERILNELFKYKLSIYNENRISIVLGDLTKPNLGLAKEDVTRLEQEIDIIYHVAANVNWSLDYRNLRESNVLPVIGLLRLCSQSKQKHFVFISSISTCYSYAGSTSNPDVIHEKDSAHHLLNGIFLGYAQSKVIAESLVEQARNRGFVVSIHRPALIFGNSNTGLSNNDDLISRMIKACVVMGCAPDLEWLVDACPVNNVADAIYILSKNNSSRTTVTHIIHPQARHWCELVLWMNLRGYNIKLLPYSEWLEILNKKCHSNDHPLYTLRPFFNFRIAKADGLTLPEIYQVNNCNTVSAVNTLDCLTRNDFSYTSLDSELLENYFDKFNETGFIQINVQQNNKLRDTIHDVLDEHYFSQLSSSLLQQKQVTIVERRQLLMSNNSSIITELASWKFGKPSGLFKYELIDQGGDIHGVFIKVKPDDDAVLHVAKTVANLSVPGLDTLFSKFKRQTGLVNCHQREICIYNQTDPRFTRFVPTPYLLTNNNKQQKYIIALETIENVVFMDTEAVSNWWLTEHIECCINGLAELHSIWFKQNTNLLLKNTQCNILTATDMSQATPLWYEIARNADEYITDVLGNCLSRERDHIIDTVEQWWSVTQGMDSTLIHNDFNPRNIALINKQGQARLCVFDWELAAKGIPQRDLAELLCFVLKHDHSKEHALYYINYHRIQLERVSGHTINKENWLYGFQLALYDLIINRIPMYILINKIKPQGFLKSMIQTWFQLYKHFSEADHS